MSNDLYKPSPDKAAKTLENKLIEGGQADNQHQIILPKNTTANLASMVQVQGSIAFDTDQNAVVVNNGSGFVPAPVGVVPINQGGTGQTTANAATNALLPSQATHSGQFLTTDGTNTSWATAGGGGGASTALDNLTTTNINQDLIPTDASHYLGSLATYWRGLYSLFLLDNNGFVAFNVFLRKLFDTSGVGALDANLRQLLNNAAAKVFDWSGSSITLSTDIVPETDVTFSLGSSSKQFLDVHSTFVDVATIRTPSGSGFQVNVNGATLQDASHNDSIQWGNRQALDSSGNISIDWQNRALYNAADQQVLNWAALTHGTSGQFLQTDGSGNATWASAGGSSGVTFDFGDASDGSATLDGVATVSWATLSGSTYLLVRQPYLTNLTINSGITLEINGYSINVRGTLTNNGFIRSNALNNATAGGSDTIQGDGGSGATGPLYNSGAIVTNPDLLTGGGGNSGNNGTTTTGTSGGGVTGSAQYPILAGNSGTAGNGSAGSGGTPGINAVSYTNFRKLLPATPAIALNVNGGMAGEGGASGGGDSVNNGGGGGGSGAGGGEIVMYIDTLNNLGTIEANGSNGAAGESPTVGNVGGGAGGGGGSGGFIYIINRITTAAGTIRALGGTGGAGGAGHGTGTAGTAGTNGSAGLVLRFQTSTGTWV